MKIVASPYEKKALAIRHLRSVELGLRAFETVKLTIHTWNLLRLTLTNLLGFVAVRQLQDAAKLFSTMTAWFTPATRFASCWLLVSP